MGVAVVNIAEKNENYTQQCLPVPRFVQPNPWPRLGSAGSAQLDSVRTTTAPTSGPSSYDYGGNPQGENKDSNHITTLTTPHQMIMPDFNTPVSPPVDLIPWIHQFKHTVPAIPLAHPTAIVPSFGTPIITHSASSTQSIASPDDVNDRMDICTSEEGTPAGTTVNLPAVTDSTSSNQLLTEQSQADNSASGNTSTGTGRSHGSMNDALGRGNGTSIGVATTTNQHSVAGGITG